MKFKIGQEVKIDKIDEIGTVDGTYLKHGKPGYVVSYNGLNAKVGMFMEDELSEGNKKRGATVS